MTWESKPGRARAARPAENQDPAGRRAKFLIHARPNNNPAARQPAESEETKLLIYYSGGGFNFFDSDQPSLEYFKLSKVSIR